jgi:hypothetical protein
MVAYIVTQFPSALDFVMDALEQIVSAEKNFHGLRARLWLSSGVCLQLKPLVKSLVTQKLRRDSRPSYPTSLDKAAVSLKFKPASLAALSARILSEAGRKRFLVSAILMPM